MCTSWITHDERRSRERAALLKYRRTIKKRPGMVFGKACQFAGANIGIMYRYR